MRFLMLMYPGPQVESRKRMPDEKSMTAMMKFNEELVRAGVLLALDGLHPSAKGVRITFPGGKPMVVDGPFPGPGDVVGAYWMLQVKSKAEAVEWAKRVPANGPETVELREVAEMAAFGVDRGRVVTAPLEQVETAPSNKAR